MGNEEKDEVKELLSRQASLESERYNYEQNWQECFDYIVPRKGEIVSTKTPGDKRGSQLFDTTAIHANVVLASALHSMLTNQTVQFFELYFGKQEIDEDDEVIRWLQEVQSIMHAEINNSNFQTEIHEFYIDLGAIGNACLFIGEYDKRPLHFGARSMKEIFVAENNLGLPDIVHRKFDWNTRQIIQEFGRENVPDELLKKDESGNGDRNCILHAVEPKPESYKGDVSQPFLSRYIIPEFQKKLSEKGFNEFPYAVSRWTKTTGETYGRGPGTDMLPDIKMINAMAETTLQGAQLTVLPPFMQENDGVIGRVKLTPAGLTVVRRGSNGQALTPLVTNARIDFGYQAMDDVRNRIRSGFFVDQIKLREGPQKTATESRIINDENLRLMGPVLGRQHHEFLKNTINRCFGILSRRGMFPEAPERIQGMNFEARYSSLVARVQRMSEAESLTRALAAGAPIINAIPRTLDLLNGDKSLRYIFKSYGAPQSVLNTEQEIKKTREEVAKAQKQAMEEAKMQHDADVVQKAGPTVVQAAQGAQRQ